MRNALLVLGAVALVIAVGVGANQAADNDPAAGAAPRALTLAQVSKALAAGAPAPLAALHARVNELKPGGAKSLDAELRALRGHPVVVNLWASWCEPCRYELPFLQRQAVERGGRVAFVGVNSGDNRDDARKLSARYPMPYPSIEDPRQALAGRYGAVGLPATAFYDARGRRVLVHQGRFSSEAQLAAEIDRYALGRP
ncbi:MAG: cytochrome c biosis protein CcmG, thiol:disulfide interchange protein DsbE [Solirubrobacteraceae bacterium]|jgi:thiol-disulfide isomerase/thioredoxin|nr:cytochrome c biosis protein CcmG, thiol:disulfide interchange protein DsbE [Solirubrobacteraceae bacterium]